MAKSDPAARIRARARAIEELAEEKGQLTAEDLVERSKDENYIFHGDFTWDDAECGRVHRLEQARQIIKEVKVTTVYHDVVIAAPMYINDPESIKQANSYVALSAVAGKEENARRVLMDEFRRIELALNRARGVSSVLGLSDDLDRMVEALLAVRGRMAA